jgi:phage shock protein C
VSNRFLVNRRDGKIMGVAAGLADYTGVDPLLIRLGLVAALLLTGPIVLALSLVAGQEAAHRGSDAAATAL